MGGGDGEERAPPPSNANRSASGTVLADASAEALPPTCAATCCCPLCVWASDREVVRCGRVSVADATATPATATLAATCIHAPWRAYPTCPWWEREGCLQRGPARPRLITKKRIQVFTCPKQSMTEADEADAELTRRWRGAGGHVCERVAPLRMQRASRDAFALLQCAAAIDSECEALREALREMNEAHARSGGDGAGADGAGADAAVGQEAPSRAPLPPRNQHADDESDGSPQQAALLSANVRPGKREVLLRPGVGEAYSAPDGSVRHLHPHLLSPIESATIVSGALVGMANAFERCGQTTLGISPALAQRFLEVSEVGSAGEAIGSDRLGEDHPHLRPLPLLYLAIERARRSVSKAFETDLDSLFVSDATLTRLRPYRAHRGSGEAPCAEACRAASRLGTIDVGELRGDRFSYARAHVDQVKKKIPNTPFPHTWRPHFSHMSGI